MTNPTANLPLPHDDFAAGFRVGWEAVYGDGVPLPRVLPMAPRLTTMGYSRFTQASARVLRRPPASET